MRRRKTQLPIGHFMNVSPLPHMKTDVNNNGAISTDFIGGSWDYPDSNWTIREQVIEAHIQYLFPLLPIATFPFIR